MAATFDYVQIVNDDDWGLMKIVPTVNGNKIHPVKTPEATIINKRRPITIISRNSSETSKGQVSGQVSGKESENNKGFDKELGVTFSDRNINVDKSTQNVEYDQDALLFGKISNLIGNGTKRTQNSNRDSILVGFG